MSPQIRDVLSRFPIDVESAQFDASDRPGFSGAVVFRVHSGGREYALRRWPAGQPDVRRIAALHLLLGRIHSAGITTVAVPRESIDGGTLVWMDDRYWQLEPWMPGTPVEVCPASDDRIRAAMSSIAEWHRTAKTSVGRSDESEWFALHSAAESRAVQDRIRELHRWAPLDLDGLLRRIRGDVDPEFARVAERVARAAAGVVDSVTAELQSVRSTLFELQPCLRDVWRDHVLFRDNEVTGLIDPSAARSENVATDIARLAGSLAGSDRRAWDVALDEYQRHRRLTFDELALVRILDRSGVLLSGLTWLRRRYFEQHTFAAPDRVRLRLDEIAGRLEHFRNNAGIVR